MRVSSILVLTVATLASVDGFGVLPIGKAETLSRISPLQAKANDEQHAVSCFASTHNNLVKSLERATMSALLVAAFTLSAPFSAHAADGGASVGANAKITTGGASTLQSGRTIAITRGVNLDRSDFNGQNLKGVAFQQSIVRDTNFKDCNLVGSSFFDATVDGSNFENADMT